MSVRTMMVVVLALVFGGSAAIGVKQLSSQTPDAPKIVTVPVVVAAVDLQRGSTVADALVKIRKVPKDQVPAGAITKLEDAVNRPIFIPMLKDEILIDAKLAPKGTRGGLSVLIPKGMRAITIKTPDLSASMAGLVVPGNKVDLLVTFNDRMGGQNSETGGAITSTLLQNVEILAVENVVDTPSTNKMEPNQARSVTLLVDTEQAEAVTLAQSKGTLLLTLRNQEDNAPAQTNMATLRRLMGKELPPEPKPEEPPAPPAPIIVQAPPPPAPEPVKEPAPAPEPAQQVLHIRTYKAGTFSVDRLVVPAQAQVRSAPKDKAGERP